MNKKILCITGNIGVGKSTLINDILKKSNKKIIKIDEPVEKWTSTILENGENILVNFYKDKKYAFLFQMNALISRIELIKNTLEQNPNETLFIMERSPDDDRFIFAQECFEYDYISQDEIYLFDYWRKVFFEYKNLITTIVLDVEPQICMDRIKIRNRKGEEEIKFSYINNLDKRYRMFFKDCFFLKNFDNNLKQKEYNSQIDFILEKYF